MLELTFLRNFIHGGIMSGRGSFKKQEKDKSKEKSKGARRRSDSTVASPVPPKQHERRGSLPYGKVPDGKVPVKKPAPRTSSSDHKFGDADILPLFKEANAISELPELEINRSLSGSISAADVSRPLFLSGHIDSTGSLTAASTPTPGLSHASSGKTALLSSMKPTTERAILDSLGGSKTPRFNAAASQITEASLQFLSCGNQPPALALKIKKDDKDEIYLLDCPNAAFYALEENGLNWQDVKKIFLSHEANNGRAIESFAFKKYFDFDLAAKKIKKGKIDVVIAEENQQNLWNRLSSGLGGLKDVQVDINTFIAWDPAREVFLDDSGNSIKIISTPDPKYAFYIIKINEKNIVVNPNPNFDIIKTFDPSLVNFKELAKADVFFQAYDTKSNFASMPIVMNSSKTFFYKVDDNAKLDEKIKSNDAVQKKFDLLSDAKSEIIQEKNPNIVPKVDPPNCSITCVGSGDAFGSQNSAFLIRGVTGQYLAFDCGLSWALNMHQLGIDPEAVKAFFISHGHADHVGGLEQQLSANQAAKTIYVKKDLEKILREKYFNGQTVGINFADFDRVCEASVVGAPAEDSVAPNNSFEFDGLKCTPIRVEHMFDDQKPLPSYALMVELPNGKKILLTGDLNNNTFSNAEFLDAMQAADLIVCDCSLSPSPVHPDYQYLIKLFEKTAIADKIIFTHYNQKQLDHKEDAIKKIFPRGFISQGNCLDEKLDLIKTKAVAAEVNAGAPTPVIAP